MIGQEIWCAVWESVKKILSPEFLVCKDNDLNEKMVDKETSG